VLPVAWLIGYANDQMVASCQANSDIQTTKRDELVAALQNKRPPYTF
jgi:hypothetical protein